MNSENVSSTLTNLFGENFKKLRLEVKDIEIDVKAFVEDLLDSFFTYKCNKINENPKLK